MMYLLVLLHENQLVLQRLQNSLYCRAGPCTLVPITPPPIFSSCCTFLHFCTPKGMWNCRHKGTCAITSSCFMLILALSTASLESTERCRHRVRKIPLMWREVNSPLCALSPRMFLYSVLSLLLGKSNPASLKGKIELTCMLWMLLVYHFGFPCIWIKRTIGDVWFEALCLKPSGHTFFKKTAGSTLLKSKEPG